jgi:hypothetical protein
MPIEVVRVCELWLPKNSALAQVFDDLLESALESR